MQFHKARFQEKGNNVKEEMDRQNIQIQGGKQ